jgi:hypothetical protein
VKLSNPYYVEKDLEVRIQTGETETIEITLEPLHEPLVDAAGNTTEGGG